MVAKRRPTEWVPLSVYYFDDEKIISAGEAAELLFIRVLAYCGRNGNHGDGYIGEQVVRLRLGFDDAEERVQRCVDKGLLQRVNGGYRVAAWHRWNRTPDQIDRARIQDRMRKQYPPPPADVPERVPEPAPDSGPTSGTPDTETDTETDTEPPLTGPPKGARPKRGTRIPQPFPVTAAMKDWVARECPQVDAPTEHQKFINYWKGKTGSGATKLDWEATWRNWMLNARDRYGGACHQNHDDQPTIRNHDIPAVYRR